MSVQPDVLSVSHFQQKNEPGRPEFCEEVVRPLPKNFPGSRGLTFVARGDVNQDGLADLLISDVKRKVLVRFAKKSGTCFSPTRLSLTGLHLLAINSKARKMWSSCREPTGDIKPYYFVEWSSDEAPGATIFAPQLIDIASKEVRWALAETLGITDLNQIEKINKESFLPALSNNSDLRVLRAGLFGTKNLSEEIEQKKGNCSSQALLGALQIATNGLSNRVVAGYVSDRQNQENLGGHVYVELTGNYNWNELPINHQGHLFVVPGRYGPAQDWVGQQMNRIDKYFRKNQIKYNVPVSFQVRNWKPLPTTNVASVPPPQMAAK